MYIPSLTVCQYGSVRILQITHHPFCEFLDCVVHSVDRADPYNAWAIIIWGYCMFHKQDSMWQRFLCACLLECVSEEKLPVFPSLLSLEKVSFELKCLQIYSVKH